MARRTMQLLSPKVFNVYDREGWTVRDDRDGCRSEYKPMINDTLNGAVIWFSHYPEGYWKPDHRHNCAHGIYVIDGALQMGESVFKPETFIWNPAGYPCGHGAAPGKDCHFLFVANRPFDIEFLGEEESRRERVIQELNKKENQLRVFPAFDSEIWCEKEEPIGSRFYAKPLLIDHETGMTVEYIRFPADFERPVHRYTCAYGLYIIRGRLVTSFGVCTKGDFIWFPPRYVNERFRTDDEECLALMITNRQYNVVMV